MNHSIQQHIGGMEACSAATSALFLSSVLVIVLTILRCAFLFFVLLFVCKSIFAGPIKKKKHYCHLAVIGHVHSVKKFSIATTMSSCRL